MHTTIELLEVCVLSMESGWSISSSKNLFYIILGLLVLFINLYQYSHPSTEVQNVWSFNPHLSEQAFTV
jgi:hypothetical protein